MPLTNLVRDNWCRFQGELFPEIRDEVGLFSRNQQRFVMALEIICPESFILRVSHRDGRPITKVPHFPAKKIDGFADLGSVRY